MKTILVSAVSVIMIFLALETAQGSTLAAVAPASCKELVTELQLMRKAQNQIIDGLASNHEQIASSLNKVSHDLMFYNKPAPLKVIHNINGMASVYRKRGEKGKDQAQSLDQATNDLIQRISLCLKK